MGRSWMLSLTSRNCSAIRVVEGEPELEGDVEGGLGQRVSGREYLGGSAQVEAGSVHVGEGGVGDVGELRGVTDHLEVPALLFCADHELVPDVHPVSVMLVNLLAADLDLYVSNDLFSDVVQPAGVDDLVRHALAV
jgi:hypothetical protein